MLAKQKVKYDVAYNGQEGVDLVKMNVYDLVFMDINMPVMNGIEAAKQILLFNKENNRPRQFIFAATAQSENTTIKGMNSVGFDSILSKPISCKVIETVLNKVIANKLKC